MKIAKPKFKVDDIVYSIRDIFTDVKEYCGLCRNSGKIYIKKSKNSTAFVPKCCPSCHGYTTTWRKRTAVSQRARVCTVKTKSVTYKKGKKIVSDVTISYRLCAIDNTYATLLNNLMSSVFIDKLAYSNAPLVISSDYPEEFLYKTERGAKARARKINNSKEYKNG